MKAKVPIAILALAIVAIAFVSISPAQASSDSDKVEIMALNQRLVDAANNKDVSAIMACYSDDPDAIFFEDTIPLQLNKAALSKSNATFYGAVSHFYNSMRSPVVVVSGDLAVVYYIAPNAWTDKSGTHSETGRYTQVDKREGGKWLIWHEHFSVPFDPATGKAVLNAKP